MYADNEETDKSAELSDVLSVLPSYIFLLTSYISPQTSYFFLP